MDESTGFTSVDAPKELQYLDTTEGASNANSTSQGFIEVMADSVDSDSSLMKSDPCAFRNCDSSGNVNLIVMAYVHNLVVSEES